ncbi:hypothetical protein [Ruegeria arenilitoris]|uniref:hypothetical protein n=1 Tax=Ruegeria arenilitoris TaxID=1173585 RepID=UPI00147E548D|nr:hypothetical protein [Ruegeria arenilitoris]
MPYFSILAVLVALVLALVFIAWRIRAVIRTIQEVRQARGLGDKLDAAVGHIPNDFLTSSMSRAGSEQPAQQSLTRLTFRATPGVIILTVLLLVGLFYISFVQPELARTDELFPSLDAETVVLIKLGVMALGIYTLIFHLANSISIDGSELVTTGPLFQRRYYDLKKLTRISLRNDGRYVLRFSDGKTARILKYVTGHDEMVQAFESALAANQESTCRSFPKSKRSAAG